MSTTESKTIRPFIYKIADEGRKGNWKAGYCMWMPGMGGFSSCDYVFPALKITLNDYGYGDFDTNGRVVGIRKPTLCVDGGSAEPISDEERRVIMDAIQENTNRQNALAKLKTKAALRALTL